MTGSASLQARLSAAVIDAQVFTLRADYRALLLAVDAIVPGPSDETRRLITTAPATIDEGA